MSDFITPEKLLTELPLSSQCNEFVFTARETIKKILLQPDQRILVVVGPCSIHDSTSAIEYAEKLRLEIEKHQETLCIVMRVYLEKPRTRTGWKGFLNDPHLNQNYAIEKGLPQARELLLTINKIGVPVATEVVNPITAPYFLDLCGWIAIGARTTESQPHREFASGLAIPVGFKNNTSGDIQAAIDGVQSASQSHHYVGIDFSGKINHIHSNGNPYCHVVLRGSKEKSNDDLHSIQQTINTLEKQRLAPRIMIDCSHGNSQKDHHQQLLSLQKIAGYISSGNHAILGVMLESNLVSGKQTWIPHQPLRYGQSITDACIGWEETVAALAMLSESVRLRRENMVSYTV